MTSIFNITKGIFLKEKLYILIKNFTKALLKSSWK